MTLEKKTKKKLLLLHSKSLICVLNCHFNVFIPETIERKKKLI